MTCALPILAALLLCGLLVVGLLRSLRGAAPRECGVCHEGTMYRLASGADRCGSCGRVTLPERVSCPGCGPPALLVTNARYECGDCGRVFRRKHCNVQMDG